jgi:ribonucleoside-diphosphate reductase alpha chain
VFKDMLLKERTDTGRIYLMFVDNVMRNTPFDPSTHPIVQTNLCVEILLPTKPFQRIEDPNWPHSLCARSARSTGASSSFRARCAARAKSSFAHFRTSGLSGLPQHPVAAVERGVRAAWESGSPILLTGTPSAASLWREEALDEVKRWMEHQAYFLTEATVELAAEKGPCKLSHTTRYGKGHLPVGEPRPGRR